MSADDHASVTLTATQWRDVASWAEDGAVCATASDWALLQPALDRIRTAADDVDPPQPTPPTPYEVARDRAIAQRIDAEVARSLARPYPPTTFGDAGCPGHPGGL